MHKTRKNYTNEKSEKSEDKTDNGIFIFHTDLRLFDNTGLLKAIKQCKNALYPVFIFTPEQISNENKYRSQNAINFMLDSLEDLSKQLSAKGGKLFTFYGHTETVLQHLIEELDIDAIFFNRSYTPFAKLRDKKIENIANSKKKKILQYGDAYLCEPRTLQKPYQKFTPYFETVSSIKIAPIFHAFPTAKFAKSIKSSINHSVSLSEMRKRFGTVEQKNVKGGREEGLRILKNSVKTLVKYAKTRDIPSLNTSRLSPHIKFGTVSIREVYYPFASKYGKKCEFIRQLVWRDFYAQLLDAFPDHLSGGDKTKTANWANCPAYLRAWKEGRTGYPLVDAGMRELVQTGYMHNRVRMVVASFLTKTLHINWRKGEEFFAQHLTDYDVASNNGNWQNISSTGKYAEPIFRVMNPWIQSEKFDPDAIYIKKWVPELADVDAKNIHKIYDNSNKPTSYPSPIVDYYEQKKHPLSF